MRFPISNQQQPWPYFASFSLSTSMTYKRQPVP